MLSRILEKADIKKAMLEMSIDTNTTTIQGIWHVPGAKKLSSNCFDIIHTCN